MNNLLPLLVLLVVTACTSNPRTTSQTTSDNEAGRLAAAEAALATDDSPEVLDVPPLPTELDSSAYVGALYAFERTGEYYTDVSFLRTPQGSDFDRLMDLADSLVYEDDEIQRRRLPHAIAKRYFNLARLDTISVYSQDGYVGDAAMIGVERFDDVISGGFVVVFKPVGTLRPHADVVYCTSKELTTTAAHRPRWHPVSDSVLTQTLLNLIDRKEKEVWRNVHVRGDSVTFSGISLATESYLLETNPNGSTIQAHLDDNYYIREIVPTHVRISNHPVLLLHMGIGETDISWTSTAAFTGSGYELLKGNRLSGLR